MKRIPTYHAGDAELRIVPDASGFKRDLEAKLKAIQQEFSVKIEADTVSARAEMERLRQTQEHDAINIGVDPNIKGAQAQLAAFRAEQHANAITIPAHVDISQTRAALSREMSALGADLASFFKVGLTVTGITNIPALVAGVAELTSALTQLSGAALVVPGAIGAAGASIATMLTGISGVKDAYTEMGKAAEDAGEGQAEQAQKAASAAQNLRNAVVDETRAQKDRADAYRDARQQLRDLNEEVTGSVLDERQAILDAQIARRDLATGRYKDALDYQQAVLRVAEADERVRVAHNRAADAQQQASDANAKGIENSDLVVDANERVVRAQQQVADAQRAATEAQEANSSASKKAAAAMAALSPQAQEFVNTLIGLKPTIEDFRNSVSGNLFNGLSESFTGFVSSVLPNLKTGMGGIATAWNDNIKTLMGSLGTEQNKGLLDRILGDTADAQKRLSGAIDPLVHALATLTAAGTDTLPHIADAIGDIAERFDEFVTAADADGRLAKWIDQGLDGFTNLGHILLNIGSTMSSINTAMGSGGLLSNLDSLTAKMAAFFRSAEGQQRLRNFFTQARNDLNAWRPIVDNLVHTLPAVFTGAHDAMNTFMPIIREFTQILREHPQLVETITYAFVAWKTIAPIVEAIRLAIVGVNTALLLMPGLLDTVVTKFAPLVAAAAALTGLYLAVEKLNAATPQSKNVGGMHEPDINPPGTPWYEKFWNWFKTWLPGNFNNPNQPSQTTPPSPPSPSIPPLIGPGLRGGGPTRAGLAVLHDDEFVQQASAVKRYGLDFMRAVNEGRIDPNMLPRFQGGGLVTGDVPPGDPRNWVIGDGSPYPNEEFPPWWQKITDAARNKGIWYPGWMFPTMPGWREGGIVPGWRPGPDIEPNVLPHFQAGGQYRYPEGWFGPAGPPPQTRGGGDWLSSVTANIASGLQPVIGNAISIGQGLMSPPQGQGSGVVGDDTTPPAPAPAPKTLDVPPIGYTAPGQAPAPGPDTTTPAANQPPPAPAGPTGTITIPGLGLQIPYGQQPDTYQPTATDTGPTLEGPHGQGITPPIDTTGYQQPNPLAQVPGLIGLIGSLTGPNPEDDVANWTSNTLQWLVNRATNTAYQAGTTLWQGALSAFDLGNSALSPNSPYFQAAMQTGQYYGGLASQLLSANQPPGTGTYSVDANGNLILSTPGQNSPNMNLASVPGQPTIATTPSGMHPDTTAAPSDTNQQTPGQFSGIRTTSGGYGLPKGTNISQGGQGFPAWVYELGNKFGLTPSTYAGHQETDRPDIGAASNPQHLNRGIDWSGPQANMNRFAQYLCSTGLAEMVIHMDPNTGQTWGYPPGVDYSSNYSEETTMVHTRFSRAPANLPPVSNPNAPTATPRPGTTRTITATINGRRYTLYPKAQGTRSPYASAPSTTGPSSAAAAGLTGNQATVYNAMIAAGFPPSEWPALRNLINSESGFRTDVRNPSSGAYGIYQFLGHETDKYGALGAYSPDPAAQSRAGLQYIKDRYGTPSAAWQFKLAHNWYDTGGWLPEGVSIAINRTGRPEAVVPIPPQPPPDYSKTHPITPAPLGPPPDYSKAAPTPAISPAPDYSKAQPAPTGGPSREKAAGPAPPGVPVPAPAEQAPMPPEERPAPAPTEAPPSTAPVQGPAGAAPTTTGTEHLLPAFKTAIESGFAAVGNIAAQAAGTATAAAIGAGSFGAGAPAAPIAAGVVSSAVSGGFQQAGKIASGIANVASSLLVDTLSMESPYGAYGQTYRPTQRQPAAATSTQVTNYNGGIVVADPHELRRELDLRDAQHYQSIMAGRI